MNNRSSLESIAEAVTEWSGSSWAFILALGTIVVWGVTGPMFGFSDTWQLVINTGTTIVTFLMVFLIQRAQNKDSRAIQLKLNELVAALNGASNRLINVEDLAAARGEVCGSAEDKRLATKGTSCKKLMDAAPLEFPASSAKNSHG